MPTGVRIRPKHDMTELKILDVAEVTGGEMISSGPPGTIKSVSIDSRTVRPGELFIAVKGENFDGHDFMAEAASKGASAIMAERFTGSLRTSQGTALIKVPDTKRAMGKLAHYIRRNSGLPVLCITGTNGKTTVKEMTAAALSGKFNVLKSRRSYNNIIGLSLTWFDLDVLDQIAVLEVGTSMPGEIAELGSIARPDAVVITNIGDGHLEKLVDRRGVLEEKASLIDAIAPGGAVFLNGDDELLSKLPHLVGKVMFYGFSEKCVFRISDVSGGPDGTSFVLNGEEYSIPAEGTHNVYNAAAAIAAAGYFGVERSLIREAIRKVSLPGMRLERIKAGGVVLINDSYNSNPGSFEAAIETLTGTSSAAGTGVVAGEMLELGRKSQELHRRVGRKIAASGTGFLITVGAGSSGIIEGALEAGMAEQNVHMASSHADAADILSSVVSTGMVVLVKGSRKTKMEEVIRCYMSSYIP